MGMKEKIRHFLKKAVLFITNPRLLLCFGIGWIITNGWSYAMMGVGVYFNIEWMMVVSGAYLAFLWLPISPEKLVTVAIAILLLRWLFPNDQKTLAVLVELKNRLKEAVRKKSAERKRKKEEKDRVG